MKGVISEVEIGFSNEVKDQKNEINMVKEDQKTTIAEITKMNNYEPQRIDVIALYQELIILFIVF